MDNKSKKLGAMIIGRFLFGQGIVTATNLVTGLLIVRTLPLSEYALYISASLLLTLISTGSDMGLSQGVNSIGSRLRHAPSLLISLVDSALRHRRTFFFFAAPIVVVVGSFMLDQAQWDADRISAVIVMVLAIGWVQGPIGIKKSILNIHHDDRALFRVGIFEAIARLVAIWVCFLSPTAEAALLTNLIGFVAARIAVSKQCLHLIPGAPIVNEEQRQQLRRFVIPLMPAVIYFMLQGHLSVFLLNISGYTNSVAEVGALGRLGQMIGLIMMLNPFLIQPFFARLDGRREFTFWAGTVSLALIFTFAVVTASGYFLPSWWLLVLGEKYSGLTSELLLVLVGAMVSLAGATVYTLVVSRGVTQGQTWTVIAGLGLQVAFVSTHAIHSVTDALILNVLPSLSYLFIQILLLATIIVQWPPKESALTSTN